MNLPLEIVKIVTAAVPEVVPYLSAGTIKAAGYDGIRIVLRGAVFRAVYGYLSGSGYVTIPRAEMSAAISQAYIETADLAYQAGGGELPLDPDTAAWARGQLDVQLAYVDELFARLKELRREGGFDAEGEAYARANGYASGLDGFYNEAVMRGTKNQMAEWVLGDTEKHCKDCAKLAGQRHKVSWFVSRDYIPRKNGAAMECGGYNCDCRLVDKDGNEITL